MAKKRNRRKRRLTIPALLLLLIAALAYFAYSYLPDLIDDVSKDNNGYVPDEIMEIHVIDVGQGDSTLFMTKNECILVDAGTNKSENDLKAYLKNIGVEKINYAIFTHPHEDHIGGADMIINNFDVEKVIMPDADSDSKTYNSLLDALETKNTDVYKAVSGDEYSIGDIKMTLLAPNSDDYSGLNDYSVVVKLEYGNSSFMLTGDAEALSEKETMIKYSAAKLKCDFLKVGHHGSSTSTSDAFLDAVDPQIATISCGIDNKYGHPHSETIKKLEAKGITYYRTDKLGSIVFECDGTSIVKK